MRLLIVRHGESIANRDHLVTGQSLSVPLTDRGREQAACTAARIHGLVGDRVVQIFSSDALRALSTAEIIAAGLPSRPEVIQTPLLREQYLGDLEGRPTSELRALPVPDRLDISEVAWGGGETIAQVHERMQCLVQWLRPQLMDGRSRVVVLVGHGDALCVFQAVLAGRDHRRVDWERDALCNAEVREIESTGLTGIA